MTQVEAILGKTLSVLDKPNDAKKNMLIFYLIISGNFIGDLFGCRLQQTFSQNRFVKHLLGFTTMVFFVLDNTKGLIDRVQIGALLYAWFVLTTLCDYRFVMVLVVSLIAIHVLDDLDVSEKHPVRDTAGCVAIGSTVLGFLVYMGEKRLLHKLHYQTPFSMIKFFFAPKRCTKDKPQYSIMRCLASGLLGVSGQSIPRERIVS